MDHFKELIVLAIVMTFATSCNSKDELGAVSGTVTIDGKPVDTGTIHFQPINTENARGAGALIEAGKFTIEGKKLIAAGPHNVVIQAFYKTGRTIKDPQKGDVAETAPILVADMPQKVTLSSDNCRDLQISFKKAEQ